MPPGKPDGAVVPFAPVQPPDQTGKPMDLAGVADALRAVATIHKAAALLRQQIRKARELPGKCGQVSRWVKADGDATRGQTGQRRRVCEFREKWGNMQMPRFI